MDICKIKPALRVLSLFFIVTLLLHVNIANASINSKPPPNPPHIAPAKGVLLVASKHISGPIFGKAVILLIEYGKDGAMGLIINKPLSATLPPPLLKNARVAQQLHFGGPVIPHAIFGLVRATSPQNLSLQITKNIYLLAGIEKVREAVNTTSSQSTIKLYAGYAGWAPGQLENEIKRGDWFLVPLSNETILDSPPLKLWQELYNIWSGQWI